MSKVLPMAGCPCGSPLGPKCPDCLEHDKAERRKRLAARIKGSDVPTPLRELRIADAPPGPAADAAMAWARGELPGLCLTGDVGVGKTWLAAGAAWERLQTHPLRWVSAARLMAQLRTGWNSKAKAQADKIVMGTGAIVLDDLDKVNPTEYGREVMFAAIDGRIEEGTPLLVTMNSSLEEIGEQLGEAIKSRLKGHCQIVRMVGRDRRLGQ